MVKKSFSIEWLYCPIDHVNTGWETDKGFGNGELLPLELSQALDPGVNENEASPRASWKTGVTAGFSHLGPEI